MVVSYRLSWYSFGPLTHLQFDNLFSAYCKSCALHERSIPSMADACLACTKYKSYRLDRPPKMWVLGSIGFPEWQTIKCLTRMPPWHVSTWSACVTTSSVPAAPVVAMKSSLSLRSYTSNQSLPFSGPVFGCIQRNWGTGMDLHFITDCWIRSRDLASHRLSIFPCVVA